MLIDSAGNGAQRLVVAGIGVNRTQSGCSFSSASCVTAGGRREFGRRGVRLGGHFRFTQVGAGAHGAVVHDFMASKAGDEVNRSPEFRRVNRTLQWS